MKQVSQTSERVDEDKLFCLIKRVFGISENPLDFRNARTSFGLVELTSLDKRKGYVFLDASNLSREEIKHSAAIADWYKTFYEGTLGRKIFYHRDNAHGLFLFSWQESVRSASRSGTARAVSSVTDGARQINGKAYANGGVA